MLTRIIISVAAVAMLMNCSRNNTTTMKGSFDSTLATHLDAIRTSNLEKLGPTVHDSVTMISPFGDRITSKATFMDFHRGWFQQTNWEWTPTLLKKEATDSLGYVLIQYRYTQKDSTGSVLVDNSNFLVLVFKNSSEGWQLVHDQNTGIPDERGKQ